MEITSCSKEDFDRILTDFGQFWEHDRTLALHHPTLLYEFGTSAFVIRRGGKIVAYLFGFLSQAEPVGYVQLLIPGKDRVVFIKDIGRSSHDS